VEKWRAALWNKSHWFFALLPLIFLIRIYVIITAQSQWIEKDTSAIFPWFGLGFDLALVLLSWFLFGSIVSLLGNRLNWIAAVFGFIILFIVITLDQYYIVSREPLDEAIFLFTWEEVWMIAGIEQRLTPLFALLLLSLFMIYGLLAWLFKKLNQKATDWHKKIVFYLGLTSLLLLPYLRYENTENQPLEALVNNRLLFFVNKSLEYSNSERVNTKRIYTTDFKDLNPEFYGQTKSNGVYPLWHKFLNKSTLSPFFNKTSDGKIPHIVIIIAESMSSDMFGERKSNTGNLMPFMDSLSEQSLYFPNALSTSQRTHNVIPAILSSVPNVVDGNAFQQIQYPNHWSLFNLLQKTHYARFYCGVPLEYLNMRGFMNYHNVNYLVQKWSKECINHSKETNSQWGFPDEDLFKQALIDEPKIHRDGKRILDLFLTISSHDPFIYPNKEAYTEIVLKNADSIPDIKSRELIQSQAENFGAFRYTDDQIRYFMEEWKKNSTYPNTIFIITGDHGTELFNSNPLAKYNVPIVVYSPLLKKNFKSKAIVSHLDIAPSLLNYFRLNYKNVQLPDSTAFVGKELVFSNYFKTNRNLVFTTNKLRTSDAFQNGIVLLGNNLYHVTNKMTVIREKKQAKKKEIQEQLALYQAFSQYAIHQNSLVPIEAHEKWVGTEKWVLAKEKDISLKGISKSSRMIAVGEFNLEPKKMKKIRVQVFAELYCKRKSDLRKTGDLLLNLKKTIWLSKKWTLFKAIRPSFMEKFKRNTWNPIAYTLEFSPKQIELIKTNKSVYFYLHNPDLQQQSIRKVYSKVEVVY
jgi:phosphoglycerol transferase MdoB-like AlkP superfamily enzyme